MKITSISQDLVAKVKTITAFESRVGLAVGGQEIDPINRTLPHPAAWCIFTGISVIDAVTPANKTVAISYNYLVKVLIDYDTEQQMAVTDFPILEDTMNAVKGTQIAGLGFHEWRFGGMILESLEPARMVWVLTFSCESAA